MDVLKEGLGIQRKIRANKRDESDREDDPPGQERDDYNLQKFDDEIAQLRSGCG